MRPAAPALAMLGTLALSGCSLWPWHHPPRPAPVAPAAASSTAALLPAPAVTAPTGASAGATDPQEPGDQTDYAPFSPSQWQRLWNLYGPLAACTDRYMASAGINGPLLGVRLVQLHQATRVLAEARPLLGDELPPPVAGGDLPAQAAQASRAVWLLMQDRPELGVGQELARKALARYDLSLVAGPACTLDPEYHALLAKALH